MTDFNEYFTHMIIKMQKEAFSNPEKADILNKLIADLWVWKASFAHDYNKMKQMRQIRIVLLLTYQCYRLCIVNIHRKNISGAAEQLFMKKGIENTSMNDIAKESGYSKATLYVYFKNKEELISVLVLESMQKLYDYISRALSESDDTKERYLKICYGLVKYQEEFPFYFQMVLETINIDFESTHFLPEEKATFSIGEQINDLLVTFLENGIRCGQIRPDIEVLPTIYSFWGMLSGLIQIATNKEAYIEQRMGKSKKDFLSYGFDLIYHSITADGREA